MTDKRSLKKIYMIPANIYTNAIKTWKTISSRKKDVWYKKLWPAEENTNICSVNITAQKTLAAAKKRMARNVLFWLFVFASTVTPSHGFIYWIYAAVLTILLVMPVYVNNLFLAPKFIAGKKYSTYLFILLPLTYVFALGYTLVLKVMLHNGLEPAYSNIVKAYNSGTTPDLSLASAIRESMPAYYGTFLVAISIFNMVWYAGIADRRQQLLEPAI